MCDQQRHDSHCLVPRVFVVGADTVDNVGIARGRCFRFKRRGIWEVITAKSVIIFFHIKNYIGRGARWGGGGGVYDRLRKNGRSLLLSRRVIKLAEKWQWNTK